MNSTNYMMSNVQKLVLFLLIDGDNWRAHKRQLFHLRDGAWDMEEKLSLEAWDFLSAVEGIFVSIATSIENDEKNILWSWADARSYVYKAIEGCKRRGELVDVCARIAKEHRDHVRVVTSNKTWKATWARRVADMLASYRKAWETQTHSVVLSRLFLQDCDMPMPKSQGICFSDIYLTSNWEIRSKHEAQDCYVRFDYPYFYENTLAGDPSINLPMLKERLRLFLTSLYYKNEDAFQAKLCFLCAAFQGVCTGKMLFQVGRGGDGKGMEAILDAALFGSKSSASLDSGVFLDRAEFRKSAELVWNKSNVRIQEMDSKVRFISEIWKRFVVDEEIDCRVNYGFTTKRRFGTSMKIQELNYENVPVIEESKDINKACEQLRRRVVCIRTGTSTYTLNPNEVDHDRGIYLLIPQEELASDLRHPVTASLYLRDWCLPFFRENPVGECLTMLHDLRSISDKLEMDTQWLAAKLSGRDLVPPGDDRMLVDANDEIVELVHASMPTRPILKEYLLHKIDEFPGCITSTRGRTTKLQRFVSAIDHSSLKLFRQVDHSTFEKLQINWARLKESMARHGGVNIFGDWTHWTCPFDLKHIIQTWDGNAFQDHSTFLLQHCTVRGVGDAVLRSAVTSLDETVDIERLKAYALQGVDRRQEMLERYIARHETAGLTSSDGMATVTVEYYTQPGYGRLLARGAAGQKLTREARAEAFFHCSEVDAACCHPRLLQQKLFDLDVWSDGKYTILALFIKHYQAWRYCVADYMDVSVGQAKTELIRIFYGGKPSCEIPFLMKLCAEVQTAALSIVHHPSSRMWRDLYSDRRNPEFSRLSGILSMEEAKMPESVSSLMGQAMCVLLFDGAYVQCRNLHDDIALCHGMETRDSRVGLQIRRWAPLACKSVPRLLVRRGQVQFFRTEDVADLGNCLLTSLYYMEDDLELESLSQSDLRHGMSARDFNYMTLGMSQGDDGQAYLLEWLPHGFIREELPNGALLAFHEPNSSGTSGHWWAAKICGDTEVAIFDSQAPECLLGVAFTVLEDVLRETQTATAFILTRAHTVETLRVPESSVYDLRGAGPDDPDDLVSIVTPRDTCLECASPLYPAHDVQGRLYTLNGVKKVTVTTKRCSRKTCRTHHHYNYRKVDGQMYHSLSLGDMKYVFVNSKVGFDRTFLDYHEALQFRGGISHNAIEFAQSHTLWNDPEQHYRWHREYSTAQLYYAVVQEAREMWCDSRSNQSARLFNLEVTQPLSEAFLSEYKDWWQRQQFSPAEWRRVKEVVMDGREKVAAKCPGNTPARVGRPRKDGRIRQHENGWFMAIDPATGLVMSATNMASPENNDIAKQVLQNIVERAPNLDCVIYDKMCVCQKAFLSDAKFRQVKYWCIDRFHARAHGDTCTCCPLVHRRLDLRLRNVNSSIAEQTFSWFRGYASTFNVKNPLTHVFYVLLYVKKHNLLIRKDYLRHLNPFSARAKAAKNARVLIRPASKKYICRRPSASLSSHRVLRKPSKKVIKHHMKKK